MRGPRQECAPSRARRLLGSGRRCRESRFAPRGRDTNGFCLFRRAGDAPALRARLPRQGVPAEGRAQADGRAGRIRSGALVEDRGPRLDRTRHSRGVRRRRQLPRPDRRAGGGRSRAVARSLLRDHGARGARPHRSLHGAAEEEGARRHRRRRGARNPRLHGTFRSVGRERRGADGPARWRRMAARWGQALRARRTERRLHRGSGAHARRR